MRQLIRFLVPLCLIAAGAGTLSARAASEPGEGQVRIEGRILMKGSMPLVKVVLESDDGRDYLLTGDPAEELAEDHRLKRVLVIGILTDNGTLPPAIEVRRYRLIKE